ncbi:alpha/beta fold hydrolase [Rhodococcus sp. IEGM1428]|uniref:alpha/beta fold hydrolase n=1 Tax=Rhodococcus sp. IEGM1428 TaxID=3392191 RepID=UPI003D124EDF
MLDNSFDPAWFIDALSALPEHREVRVAGASVHLRCWGDERNPGVVLVHGGGANSAWWDHIAPFLSRTHRVVAPDLTGHGDSGHRAVYAIDTWADELVATVDAGAITSPPIVIGHSMGGYVGAALGVRHPESLSGLVMIDTPLVRDEPQTPKVRRPPRLYRTAEEIYAKFTLSPAQRVMLPYVGRHVAQESVRQEPGGWTWKFDPERYFNPLPERAGFGAMLSELRTAAVYLRSEHGLVSDDMARRIDELQGHRMPMVELADSGHHPMMDHPLALVAALRSSLQLHHHADRRAPNTRRAFSPK